MTLRYLFGPVSGNFPAGNLRLERDATRCLTFGPAAGVDLAASTGDTWQDLCARFPQGWLPDFVVLDLHYTTVPSCLWSAPVPIVGLAADWNLLWHYYRHSLRRCDLVLTDSAGVAALGRQGVTWVQRANLFGCGQEFLDYTYPEGPRDIDVLFVGNLHPAVQRERLPWLQRLARLAERWRVVIRTGVFGDGYRELLGRARIVFNHSVRSECNMRTFEAAAAGALLFQEEGNLEVPAYFRPGEEFVPFTEDNLEARLAYYLEREEERRRVAQAARARVGGYSFADLWRDQLAKIEEAWPALLERARERAGRELGPSVPLRVWQALSTSMARDPALVRDLEKGLRQEPSSAPFHHLVGLTRALIGHDGNGWKEGGLRDVVERFRDAWALDQRHILAGLNLAEALAHLGQTAEAAEQARAVLGALEECSPGSEHGLDEGHFPPVFDHFRVEWERAAWAHAGDSEGEVKAKRDLLRWRLHALVADLTDSLDQFRAAAAVRPDLPLTQAALGCALGRAARFAEAVGPLQTAVAGNPFDRAAARALFDVLKQTGDEEGQRRLIIDRRLLARAAPQCVLEEPWFTCQRTAPANRAGGPGALRVKTMTLEKFQHRFGNPDTGRALCGYTPAGDTHVVLSLLAALRPRRIVEVGTGLGHMTANLSEWSPDDATVFTLGTVADLPATGRAEQAYENPSRAEFGRFAGHFGKSHKILFATADSRSYDFGRLAPVDFAFIDGAHDFDHVLSDTRGVHAAMRPGGCLVWHDFRSPVAWVEVQQAVEAAGLDETIYHVAGTQVAFLFKEAVPSAVARAPGPVGAASPTHVRVSPNGPVPADRLAIVWEGDQAAVHSLALVNRAFCQGILDRGHHVSLRPLEFVNELRVPTLPLPARLAECCGVSLPRPPDVHVRHHWPPNFTPPSEGHWVIVQPWEFGSLPRLWLSPMTELVDEIWVYTSYVRDCYVRSGVPGDRVHVVPLGVDPARFRLGLAPTPLRTTKRCKFLFVGGTIHRKGIDLLLQAYAASFRRNDDVCLVIKDMGVGTFYRGQTAEERIAAFRADRQAPEIEYIDGTLPEEELARLYAACDCLAQPYRGEGFGLPIAEAMACGLPVIVTGYGACLDFCGPEHGYLVPAREVRFPERRIGDLETVDYPWLAEPDVGVLAQSLRHVYEHPDDAGARGAKGAAHIHGSFTWQHAVAAAERRLLELRRRPVNRFAAGRQGTGPVRNAALPIPAARGGPRPGESVYGAPSPVKLAGNGIGVAREPRVSLCMIVKNEEKNLPVCLGSVQGLFDDIVVVDTGSADRTKEIAARLGARVFDFAWVDSFAEARNESLRHARGKYAFWLDADDRVDAANHNKLRALLAGLGDANVAYVMKCLCLPDPVTRAATVVDHIRLFRRHPELRWRYRVHEQILPGLADLGAQFAVADVVIEHTGYLDAPLRRRKLERDLRLLALDRAERPDDPFVLFNLGQVYQEQGRTAEALAVLQESLARAKPEASIVRKLYALIADCQRRLGRPADAVVTCTAGRERCPKDAEILFEEALARRELKDPVGEETCWRQLLDGCEAPVLASVDTGLVGYKARHNLAVLCVEQGRLAEATALLQGAAAERPDFWPSVSGLAQVLVLQGRWADLEKLAQRVEAVPGGDAPAALLRAKGLLACRQYAAARQILDVALVRHPNDRPLWEVLSQALLEENKDPVRAEAALRRILELDPGNAAACQNLTLLLTQTAAA
jgi:glycosyltransferase involved in cell wall biosynthesis/predicted O-methyltransferase YrrM/Flp pilus assembly protein TadD